jgi:hypothetical protein
MTQGRDGISLAPTGAPGHMGVARRLSVVAAVFAIAALVAGTAGTSYAKSKKIKMSHRASLLDQVAVTNYGAAFGGSIETFLAGARRNSGPAFWVKGTNTLLGAGTGPAGVSASSLDDHVAVAVPIDLIDLAGFGGFPAALACTGAGAPAPCCTGFHTGVCLPGTGFAEIFSPGATKNSAPESVIGTRNVTFGFPDFSGVNTPQGVAYEDPFDGVNPGRDILAVTNTLPFPLESLSDGLNGSNGGVACNAFGSAACTGVETPLSCCTGPGTGSCAGFTVGTITEFDTGELNKGTPGYNDLVEPFNNSPVIACTGAASGNGGTATDEGQCLACLPPAKVVNGVCNSFTLVPSGEANATIAGCLTFLLGPVGAAFDANGFLFVVNEAGVASGGPGFVTVYAPGASGDPYPVAVMGLIPGSPTPPGTFKDPAYITVDTIEFEDDLVFVTDVGDNSIKIFSPFENFDNSTLFFEGSLVGTIHGGHTKLKRPEGIALGMDDGALYVVNNQQNTLSMFTDFSLGGGDIAPTLIMSGRNTKLNLPVGVAVPAFTPSARETISARAN